MSWIKSWLLPKLAENPYPAESDKPSGPIKRDFKGKTLGQKQRMFTLMIAELILYAYNELGYELSVGDFFRDPRSHGAMGTKIGYSAANSVHKLKLAGDLNLFINGEYQTSTEAHRPLGEYWEAMGGTWGGRFSSPDGNHYSIEEGGYK